MGNRYSRHLRGKVLQDPLRVPLLCRILRGGLLSRHPLSICEQLSLSIHNDRDLDLQKLTYLVAFLLQGSYYTKRELAKRGAFPFSSVLRLMETAS
jgi:hypothetical protein